MSVNDLAGHMFKEAYFTKKGSALYAVLVFENCNNYEERPLIFHCWELNGSEVKKVTLSDAEKLMPIRLPNREVKAHIPGFRTDFRYASALTQELWKEIHPKRFENPSEAKLPNAFYTEKYRPGWEELLLLAYLEPYPVPWSRFVIHFLRQNPNPKSIPIIQKAFEASYSRNEIPLFWGRTLREQEQLKITHDNQRVLINLILQCVSKETFSPVLDCIKFDKKWYSNRKVAPFLVENINGQAKPCSSVQEYVKNVFLQKFGTQDEWEELFKTAKPPEK